MTVIQTKMAAALGAAFTKCVAEGHNPGRIGHRILTNQAKDVGVKYREKLTLKKKKQPSAVSAVIKLKQCEVLDRDSNVIGETTANFV